MVDVQTVDRQLRAAGCQFRVFGRFEIHELAKVLAPDETIKQAVFGYYDNGFAVLAVTDQRVILVDKKPMFLTIEDVRFDMIAEVDFNHRLLDATLHIYTLNKTLTFTSWSHRRLRRLLEYVQQHVLLLRQQLSQPAPIAQQIARSGAAMTPADSIPVLAHLAMQGNISAQQTPTVLQPTALQPTLPNKLYTHMPLIRHRRRFAKYYSP